YMWKEDVIRPKLALTQFCRDRVKVTEDDLQKAFDNRFGPKVQCRMILLPKEEGSRQHLEVWTKVSKDEKALDEKARTQAIPPQAARNGEVPPVCMHCGDDRIEKAAFSLKPGDVGPLIDTPDGAIILKCVRHIPRDETKKLVTERPALEKEILD